MTRARIDPSHVSTGRRVTIVVDLRDGGKRSISGTVTDAKKAHGTHHTTSFTVGSNHTVTLEANGPNRVTERGPTSNFIGTLDKVFVV